MTLTRKVERTYGERGRGREEKEETMNRKVLLIITVTTQIVFWKRVGQGDPLYGFPEGIRSCRPQQRCP